MAKGSIWHRTLAYFGLVEDDDDLDDLDDETGARDQPRGDSSTAYRERPPVRKVQSSGDDYGEIFPDEQPTSRRGRRGRRGGADPGAQTAVLRPAEVEAARGEIAKVHLIAPRSFNDAQQIADRFKRDIPVIINLQAADASLAKRLIDFGSGLTYALDGGMQRIADKVFLLTPRDVELSAEDRARYVESGFFNQA